MSRRIAGKEFVESSLLVPVSLVLLVVPLVIRLIVVTPGNGASVFYGSGPQGDLYAQMKLYILLWGCGLLLLFYALAGKKLYQHWRRIPAAVFCATAVFLLGTLLSVLLSGDPAAALWGLFRQAEGFVTQLCYVLLFLYTALAYREEWEFRFLTVPLLAVAAVNLLLGGLQYFGVDWLDIPVIHSLVIPADSGYSSIHYDYAQGKMYGTLPHYNYLGSLAILLLPFFVGCAGATSRRGRKFLFCAAAAISLVLLLGSTSRAGLVGLVAVIFLSVLLFSRVLLSHWKLWGAMLALMGILAAGGNLFTGGALFERIPTLAEDIKTLFSVEEKQEESFALRDITHQQGKAFLWTQEGFLELSYDNGEFTLRDGAERLLPREGGCWNLAKTALNSYNLQNWSSGFLGKEKDLAILSQGELPLLYFRGEAGVGAHLVSPYTLAPIELDHPPIWGFEGKETIGSMRGYIWSRSLPLIPQCLLTGFGPDQYLFHFPQYDLLGKYNAYQTTNVLITRPHNLYLQIFLNNGGLAFAACMLILVWYAVQSLRIYARKRHYSPRELGGIGIFLGVCGYLAAGFFNDSTLSVAPVFWVLLGMGFAVNHTVGLTHNKRLCRFLQRRRDASLM